MSGAWNDETRAFRDDIGTWRENTSDIIIEDWDRIGDYYIAYYRISGRTCFNPDGTRKTHKDPYFPPGYMPKMSPRKQMIYSIGNTPSPAVPLLPDPPEDC